MKFCNTYAEYGITSIAIPKLGCDNRELNWDVVKALILSSRDFIPRLRYKTDC